MSHSLSVSALAPRSAKLKLKDRAALRAIAQMAVNVELFTIPIYMTSLYSIQGMHPITGANTDFYKGRLWAGAKSTAAPKNANDKAFNIVFSVFIQEMLHLQMAANMATIVGASPRFTGAPLQDDNRGWTCFGPDKSVIPGIIDLKDTIAHEDVPVNIGPLDEIRVRLFLAIEQPETDARANIKPDKVASYFPKAPFDDWAYGQPLPLFGTIGWMYQCYYDYLNLRYDDGSSLWDYAFTPTAVQNDLFNTPSGGHPMREFMGFETTIATTYSDIAFGQMVQMMDAITDQGEGSVLHKSTAMLKAVEPRYQPNDAALKSDYPSYSDAGKLMPSADAAARYDNDGKDHYERFQEVQALLGEVVTWPKWLAGGRTWTAKDLQAADYKGENPYGLPTPDAVAGALNALAAPDQREASRAMLSRAVIGAIYGVTSVLDNYWTPPADKPAPLFPFPSMSGSGDRMSTCWAVLGEAPDLSIGLPGTQAGALYHACQGLDLTTGGGNGCAQVEIFHSCRGSNDCRGQGGCGFVQPTTGGGNCGTALATRAPKPAPVPSDDAESQANGAVKAGCGPPPPDGNLYSAPTDNKCGTFGGCAVPISASQVFPKAGTMQLFNFVKDQGAPDYHSVPIKAPAGEMAFAYGAKVHDVAYEAFAAVMKARGQTVPATPPEPDNIRLAFPPST
jgi:hypothetical protein